MSRRRLGNLNPKGLLGLAVNEKSDDADLLPAQVPGYEIRSIVGRGAAGAVYEAIDENSLQAVAIKLLSREHISDVLQRERIAREAQVMGSLSHPNLVTVYDFIESEATVGIVMELVSGETLRARLRRKEEIEIEEVVRITSQIGAALNEVHKAGLTHRDLKPENILIDEAGNIKVTDFGIAFSADEAAPRLTLTGMTLGTIGYMSPEQAEGLSIVDFRSDIYSLGIILHELLTGQSPDGMLEPPALFRRDLPAYINDAVLKALSPDPADRYPGVADFVATIKGLSPKETGSRNPLKRFRKK